MKREIVYRHVGFYVWMLISLNCSQTVRDLVLSGALFTNTRDRHTAGASPLTRQSQLPQHMTTSKQVTHGAQDKSQPGPVVVTSPGKNLFYFCA